jgi:hypothetical protein
MAQTKQTQRLTPVKASSPTFNASSPRRKMKEVSKSVGGATRGSKRINCVRAIECEEGCQPFVIEVPNKTGMEGFTRDLSNVVSTKNPLVVASNVNCLGKLRAVDGSNLPRNNQRRCWIKSPVRMADEPETDVELLAVGERIAEASLTHGNVVLFSFHLAHIMFMLLSPGAKFS